MTTGFIIFAVLWTIATALFIIVNIFIDLEALRKAAQSDEEIINLDEEDDETDDFSTQNVVEDTESGGFSLSPVFSPSSNDSIQEEDNNNDWEDNNFLSADNEQHNDNEAESTDSNNNYAENGELPVPDEYSQTEDFQNANSFTEDYDNEDVNDDNNIIEPILQDDIEEEYQSVIPSYTFSDKEDIPKNQSFNEDEAFDPSLRQTHYDVRNTYEPSVSAYSEMHADTVNASTESITTKSKGFASNEFRAAMLNHNSKESNIEFYDEQTKY